MKNKKINDIFGPCERQHEYFIQKLKGYTEALFELAPFKVCDRVVLVDDVILDDRNHGWYSCQHFLKKDSIAIVHDVDYCFQRKSFVVDVVFDIESWIDSNKKERPVTERHEYRFTEKSLRKISSDEESGIIQNESVVKRYIRNFSVFVESLLRDGYIERRHQMWSMIMSSDLFDTPEKLISYTTYVFQLNIKDYSNFINELLRNKMITAEDYIFEITNRIVVLEKLQEYDMCRNRYTNERKRT